MTIQDSLTRRYRMLCLGCDHTWEATYEIRTLHDDAGDHELFYRNGTPAIGRAMTRCPGCGGLRVRVMPHHLPA